MDCAINVQACTYGDNTKANDNVSFFGLNLYRSLVREEREKGKYYVRNHYIRNNSIRNGKILLNSVDD